jgi:uncharacterized cupin superfamily protein
MIRRVNLNEPELRWDDDPEGFRSGMFRTGPSVGAARTGATLYELPPGQSICPYHYEYGEEEWLLVVQGRATVRTPDETDQLEPMELVFFPTGPAGAHEIRNDTDSSVRVLMWSEVVTPTATAYPDSGKVGVYTGDKAEDGMFERSSNVDYFHGEGRG